MLEVFGVLLTGFSCLDSAFKNRHVSYVRQKLRFFDHNRAKGDAPLKPQQSWLNVGLTNVKVEWLHGKTSKK